MEDLSTLLRSREREPTSVLLLEPADGSQGERACIDLLGGHAPQEQNVLSIAVSDTTDDRLAVWRTHAGDVMPRRAAVIDTGRTRADESIVERIGRDPAVTVDVLDSPINPAELAMTVGQYLGAWDGTPERTRVCIDSASALLAPLDRQSGEALLDALTTRFAAVGAVVHFHADPKTDDATLEILARSVDVVVEYDHGWTVTEPPIERLSEDVDRPPDESDDSAAEGAGVPAPDRVPEPRSLDSLLSVFSDARRRQTLYQLLGAPDGTATVDALVETIAGRETESGDAITDSDREAIAVSLVHTHLPRLESAGFVEFDPGEGTVSYVAPPDLDTCIEYLRALDDG